MQLIAHLIRTQVNRLHSNHEFFPRWFVALVGRDRLKGWLLGKWDHPLRATSLSHFMRPWGECQRRIERERFRR